MKHRSVWLAGLAGLGLGWLIGLSVSPVIASVVASVLALIVTITGAVSGVKAGDPVAGSKFPISVDVAPVALLVIGLAIGSSVGVYARTNDLLGPDLGRFTRKWAKTGLPETEITRRLFDAKFQTGPFLTKNGGPGPTAGVGTSVLFANPISAETCDALTTQRGDALRAEMRVLKDKRLVQFADRVRDDRDLEAAVDLLLCPSQDSSH